MAPVTLLRETKKQRTREAFADAARELFAARGYDATTIDDLAQAAGVSRRTFFRYFQSKEAVLFPVRVEQLARFRAILARSVRGEAPFDRVRRALIAIGEELVSDRDRVVALNDVVLSHPALIAHEQKLDLELEAAIAAALAEGEVKSKAGRRRARVLAGATFGAVRAVIREWFAERGKTDLIALGNEALDLIDRGRAKPVPRKRARAARRTRHVKGGWR